MIHPNEISVFAGKIRMHRSGKWKIVKENGENWKFYNMKNDKTELNNLADSHPEQLDKIIQKYEDFKDLLQQELIAGD